MTTIVEPDVAEPSLWQRVWLNVLPRDDWEERYTSTVPFEFPWNRPLSPDPVTPQNAHQLEMLWQTPRRWRITTNSDGQVTELLQEGNGRNYTGWEFPLTGFFFASTKEWVEMKMNPQIGFKEWASLAVGLKDKARVAPVVSRHLEGRMWQGKPLRLRCFGWALGDAAAVGAWTEMVVPYYVDVEHEGLEQAIALAESTRARLTMQLKDIAKHLGNESSQLYNRTQQDFYRRVGTSSWDGWEKCLRAVARDIYWNAATLYRHDMVKVGRAMARL